MTNTFANVKKMPLTQRLTDSLKKNLATFGYNATDPQQNMPIIGLLALLPGPGLFFAILGLVISRRHWPLPLRAERGYWLCVIGAAIHGLVIGGLLAAALVVWFMNALSTII